ncbi:virulence protein [Sphingomonas sp. ID1715]|uniref:DUF7146 domain-containing protein n=1 Tax=Sphingomonas sp. ID1715 TaxID=1656898 RepID=UPI00148891F8|nr:toprim domain-containing protein [Sphingomonas sp. ID1715]NNM77992.1 virulence protein [Sphingomonas sp. ID1715]
MSSSTLTSPADEGRAIVEQLGGHWSRNGGVCRCPAHDDRTPSLSVRVGRSRLLLHCFAGCNATDILRALQARRLLGVRAAVADDPAVAAPEPNVLAKSATRIWSDARIIAQTPAERYLRSRAITLASPELRYHPRTPHGPKPFTQFRPALIAAVRDDAGLIGIHRTFLDRRNGRLANLPAPKLGLGRFGSGAVRLWPAAPRLGLAEGLETALSATMLFDVPCWATLGTERFGLVKLPAIVRELVLFLDNDKGGRRAEALARKAFRDSVSIETRYPRVAGFDWNDVLQRRRRT